MKKVTISGWQEEQLTHAVFSFAHARLVEMLGDLYDALAKIEGVKEKFYDLGLDDQQVLAIRKEIKALIGDVSHICIDKEEN